PYAPVYLTGYLLWLIATLILAAQSTGLIGSERSRQTLDVLLTTPLTSETIVREKLAGTWRLMRVLWVPLATVYLFQFWWICFVVDGDMSNLLYPVVGGGLAMLIYPPLIVWLGFYAGLRSRSQAQATLVCLGLIAA